jgi:Holliday junction resolvase RusA-like endonuclease
MRLPVGAVAKEAARQRLVRLRQPGLTAQRIADVRAPGRSRLLCLKGPGIVIVAGAEGAVAFLDTESGRKPITVWVTGEPVPYARMRLSKIGVHFVPPMQRNFAAVLRIEAGNAMAHAHAPMFDEPLRMELLAEFGIPASWSKKKRGAAIRGEIRPGKRPDIDNLYKLVADSFNGIVYRDDALIVEVRARKIYGVQPKLIVTIWPAA